MNCYELRNDVNVCILVRFGLEVALQLVQNLLLISNLTSFSLFLNVVY